MSSRGYFRFLLILIAVVLLMAWLAAGARIFR